MVIDLDNLDDPRLIPYRRLKDRELARRGDRFIAEGDEVVRRLLESGLHVESVLCADSRMQRIEGLVPEGVPIYRLPLRLVCELVGFAFHNGVMAVGVRAAPLCLADFMQRVTQRTEQRGASASLLVCPELANTENLGLVLRIAAALGVGGMLIGPRCCDPWFRQSVRVSMGAALRLPIRRADDLAADLRELRARWGLELIASVCDSSGRPLGDFRPRGAWALLLGGERHGLDDATIAACDQRLTVPMHDGVDSLNVAIAAAVMLWELLAQRA